MFTLRDGHVACFLGPACMQDMQSVDVVFRVRRDMNSTARRGFVHSARQTTRRILYGGASDDRGVEDRHTH